MARFRGVCRLKLLGGPRNDESSKGVLQSVAHRMRINDQPFSASSARCQTEFTAPQRHLQRPALNTEGCTVAAPEHPWNQRRCRSSRVHVARGPISVESSSRRRPSTSANTTTCRCRVIILTQKVHKKYTTSCTGQCACVFSSSIAAVADTWF